MVRTQRLLVGSTGLALFLVMAGLMVFVRVVDSHKPSGFERADGIVVLTGGERRIVGALGLLADGRGRRLLISGVNRANSRAHVLNRLGAPTDMLFTCCIDIGYRAHDTIGNAEETLAWVRAHRLESVIVVTSNYHMPRSLVELQRVLPDVKLVPYPVVSPNARMDTWWLRPGTARLIVGEYLKLFPSMLRLGASRLAHCCGTGTPKAPTVTTQATARSGL